MKWNIYDAAREWKLHRETLAKKMTAAGFELKPRATFTTLEICGAIYSDIDASKAREAAATAQIREMEAGKMSGDLVRFDSVCELFRESLLPVRQRLMSLPNEICARANPLDPTLAREVAQQWVDEALKQIRSELPR